MSILKITSDNFNEEVINANKTTVVDFYADWCGPCKIMSPVIDKIAEENDNIKVGKINVDEEQDLAMKYDVNGIPTIVIFKDGKENKRFVGVTDKETILNELK